MHATEHTLCSLSPLPWIFTLFEHIGWPTIIRIEREKTPALPSLFTSIYHHKTATARTVYSAQTPFTIFFGIMTVTQRMLSPAIIIH